MLGYLGFSALAVQEGRSFVEVGKRIGSDLVTITDDGRDPAGLPYAFDFEGVAKQRVPLVEAGAVPGRRLRLPDRGARRRRIRPATASRRPNAYGPFPLNMVMHAGPCHATTSSPGWTAACS